MYLRLGEHVETPRAHFAISGNADQVVSILGSYHIDAVDWMLSTAEECVKVTGMNQSNQRKMKDAGKQMERELKFITVCAAADKGVL